MKNKLDLNYEASEIPNQKHRALSITKPFYNMSGIVTCSTQTFQSSDKRSAEIRVIGKSSFIANYK